MKKNNNNSMIFSAKDQLHLYGYSSYFDSFSKLFIKKKLPNTILISGSKGIGKSTFIHHFINFLLSTNEEKKYDQNNFIINKDNRSYKLTQNNLHPNFFNVGNDLTDNIIGVDQIREILNFLNKTTNSDNLKLILIDNIENLNVNSSNALLKALEEPNKNTYFFLIHHSGNNILNTIKSRCSEFKIHFTKKDKDKILENILVDYKIHITDDKLFDFLNYDTPGNLLNYISSLEDKYSDISSTEINFIIDSINKYEKNKNKNLFYTIVFLIEKFYYELCTQNLKNFNNSIFNYDRILKQIYNLKKYNLNEKGTLKLITNILYNETR